MKKAWSYSAMKVFETCARKYHAEKVEKLYPFKESAATLYGKEVHKAAELYIQDGVDLPEEHKRFRKALDALNRIEGEKICEQKMALDYDRNPSKYFGKQVWIRGAADLLIIDGDLAYIVDYKTGSAKYPDKDQLELMAMMVFDHYPDVQRVKAALVFLVHNKVVKGKYSRDNEDKLWKKWGDKDQKLQLAYENDHWPPNPNGLCRNYCPVEHCEYQGD